MIFVLYAKHSFVLLTNLTSYPNFCNECSDYFRKMLFYISSIVGRKIFLCNSQPVRPMTLSGTDWLGMDVLFHSCLSDIISFCLNRKTSIIKTSPCM